MKIDSSLGLSRTLQFGAMIRQLKQDGKDIISLGLGEPEFDTPDHIKDAASAALADGLTRYSAAAGLDNLREATARKLCTENGLDAKPDELLICPGAKNALFLACAALLRPGDEVVNLTPCYVSNVPILKLAEPDVVIRTVELQEDTFELPFDALRAAVNDRTRLVLVNYPNNPTGRILSTTEAELLVEIMTAHEDLYLLSDEIYESLMLCDLPLISPGSFPKIADRVVTVGGFSKAYSMTGWRIGYLHARKEIWSTALKIHQQLNTNTAAFIQKAALAALEGPQNHLDDFRLRLCERTRMYADLIEGHELLSGLVPQGGFFGFLNISRAGMDSDSFSAALLEHKQVAVLPGIAFGDHFDHYVRVSLVNETAAVAEGLLRIGQFMSETEANN